MINTSFFDEIQDKMNKFNEKLISAEFAQVDEPKKN